MADENDQEIEVVARNMGWVPEEEWDDSAAAKAGRPKPRRFKSAREFVDSVRANLPIALERNEALNTQVTTLKTELEQTRAKLEETGNLVRSMHDNAQKLRERAFQQGREDVLKRMEEAADEGDGEKFRAARAELDKIDEEAKVQAEPKKEEPAASDQKPKANNEAAPQVDAETQAWVDANAWFQKDITLNSYMIEMHGAVRNEHPGLSISEQLEMAADRVKERFPEKFGINPHRDAPATVGSPGRPRVRDGGPKRLFSDLPEEDRQNFRSMQRLFKERGEEYTEEQFLADYAW